MAPSDRASHHRTARPSGTGLRGLLRSIDGSPFQAYRRILGEHELGDFRLSVLSVPPDALGGPARLRLWIDRAGAGLDGAWSRGALARMVLEDSIVRAASHAIDELNGPSAASAPGSGRVWIDPPGPAPAERTSARAGDDGLELSVAFDLPATARRVRGQQAEAILFEHLPRVGMAALLFPLRRVSALKSQVEVAARRRAAAGALVERGFAALVPEAALPGRSAPPSRCATIETTDGVVAGFAIPTGITLFLTTGVFGAGVWLRNLVSGAGRVSDEAAILASPVATLRATRRAFGPLDVRAFVRACPEVPDPGRYATEDAPTPLALAASLVEATEAGARILVLDADDTPAGAFGRDARLQLVLGDRPSIAPLAECLAELRDRWGLSFFVAARAMGDLCEVADAVFVLRGEVLEDATDSVRRSARTATILSSATSHAAAVRPRSRLMRVVTTAPPEGLKVAAWGGRGVRVGEDLVDLKDTTAVGDAARLRAIAALLKRAAFLAAEWCPVEEVLDALESASAREELDRLEEPGLVDLIRPSRIEIASALVRWKRVTFRVDAGRLRAAVEDLQ